MKLNLHRDSIKFLFLLLLADAAFILFHGFYKLHLVTGAYYSIGHDLGYAEVYQYIKELWIIALLLIAAVARNRIIYFTWALLFVYLLLDDSLQIHENLGIYLSNYFDIQPMFRLRAQDFGELAVSMFFGLFLFSFIGASYLYSDSIARKVSKHLFILVMALAFFGVFIDMITIAIPWGQSTMGLIEEIGEILIMSIIVWYVFNLKHDPENLANS